MNKFLLLGSILMSLAFYGCAGQARFHYSAKIPGITVHIIEDATQFPPNPYDRDRLMGLALGNEIWILGTCLPDGTIVTNEVTLGHEISHVLAYNIPLVKNPDRLSLREEQLARIFYQWYDDEAQKYLAQAHLYFGRQSEEPEGKIK